MYKVTDLLKSEALTHENVLSFHSVLLETKNGLLKKSENHFMKKKSEVQTLILTVLNVFLKIVPSTNSALYAKTGLVLFPSFGMAAVNHE